MKRKDQSSKAEMRPAALARRDALTEAEVTAASGVITEEILRLPEYYNAETVCSYMRIGNEVDTAAIIRAALAQGKRVVLPRTLFAEHILILHQVTDLDHLIPGRCNIPEPSPDAPRVSADEVDCFLVPGLAFDTAGNRLGFGAGFYDMLLSESQATRVALAFTNQLVARVPADSHDYPMDFIVTEAGVIDCRLGRQPSDHLRLRNIQSYGHHGVFPEEREKGLRLAFDVDLKLDLQCPGLTDHLNTTVNYPAVYHLVERIQSGKQFHLLEALVEQVASAILAEFPLVREVTVTARKFNPPVGGPLDAFEVEITRSRPES